MMMVLVMWYNSTTVCCTTILLLTPICGGSTQAANNMFPQLQLYMVQQTPLLYSRPLVLVRHAMLLIVVAYLARAVHSITP